MIPLRSLFAGRKLLGSREISRRIDEFLIQAVRQGDSRICLADKAPLPPGIQDCDRPGEARRGGLLQYRDIVRRLAEIADIAPLAADRESRGRFILKFSDSSYSIEVHCGPGGSWLTIEITPFRFPEPQRVVVPGRIWAQVRPSEDGQLHLYDVRLKDGTVHKRLVIDGQGLIEGCLFRKGNTNTYVSVQFDSEEIVAIRPRTRSFLAELGLGRWI